MSWHSWCCHGNGDIRGWHNESLPQCWCKMSLCCSYVSGSNTRPHLEETTQQWQKTDSLIHGYHSVDIGVGVECCTLFGFLSLVSVERPCEGKSLRSFFPAVRHHYLQGWNIKAGARPEADTFAESRKPLLLRTSCLTKTQIPRSVDMHTSTGLQPKPHQWGFVLSSTLSLTFTAPPIGK